MTNKINIGVTGTGSLIGQAIIKSICRSNLLAKINIIGFDYFPNTVGSFWVAENFLLPDILKKEITVNEWINVISELIVKKEIKLLFVGVDFELSIFSKYKSDLERKTGVKILVSDISVIRTADDKFLTYKFLKNNGLFYPKSFLPNEINLEEIEYPVIVKPRKGARSVGVSKVENKKELIENLAKINNPIIQEIIGSDSEEFTCGTIYLNDELKKSIILKRTLKDGNTYISSYNKSFPEIIKVYLNDVVEILKPFGACNFQLRMDKEGIPKIFEINSRHSGTTYIRSLYGYREIEYMINYILFNKEIDFNLKEGKVIRYFEEFFVSE